MYQLTFSPMNFPLLMDLIYNMVNTQFFKEDTHAPGLGTAVGGAVQRSNSNRAAADDYQPPGFHSMYQTLGLGHMGKEEDGEYGAAGLIVIRAALPSAAFDWVVSTRVVCYEHLGYGSIPFHI